MTLTPSDYVIIGALAPAIYFTISYGGWSPWWRSALGSVVFFYAVSVVALLTLIAYGTLVGTRVGEGPRLAVAVGLFVSLTAKSIILHMERRAGNIARRQSSSMSDRRKVRQ